MNNYDEIHDYTAFTLQTILAVCGIFGHFNIICATIKKKELRTKHGYLILQMSIWQVFCIVGEYYSLTIQVFYIYSMPSTCLKIVTVIMISNMMQAILMLFLSIDLLLTVLTPLLYRFLSVFRTVIITIIICIALSILYCALLYFLYSGQFLRDDVPNLLCNVEDLFADSFLTGQHLTFFVIGILQMTCYAISYSSVFVRSRLFEMRHPNQCYRNVHRKTMRTIFVFNFIFVFTWLFAVLIYQLTAVYELPGTWKHRLRLYASILSMINFSQTFYVSLWRSADYRKTFRSMWKNTKKTILKNKYIKDICTLERTKASIGISVLSERRT